MLRCVIVDDNSSFLAAAAGLLEREGIAVVGVASNAAEALGAVDRLRPDVVLVDVNLGRESGIDLARCLGDADSPAAVILISTYAESDFAELIADAPVLGFVAKSDLSAAAVRQLVGDSQGR